MTDESRSYSEFVAALVDILAACEIPYAVAGSLASGLYGEPRTTLDVDLTLQLAVDQVEALVSDAGSIGLVADDVAIRERLRQVDPQPFNIVDLHSGWKADCYPLRGADYDRTAFGRRRQIHFPASAQGTLWVYAPEDVILYKMVYYKMSQGVSVKHLRDIAGMLAQFASTDERLDERYIRRWANTLDVANIWSEIEARGPS